MIVKMNKKIKIILYRIQKQINPKMVKIIVNYEII